MIKKTSLLICILVLTSNSYSQKGEVNYYYDWDYTQAIYEPIQYFPSKDVKEIHFTQTRSGKTKEYVKRYKDGHLEYYASIDEEGKEVPIYEFEFNDFGQSVVSKAYRKGNLKYTIKEDYEENGGGRILLKKHMSNGKLKLKNTWEYKSTDCLSSSTRIKGNRKVHRKWVYSYYDKCDKKKTELYNGKDKLLKTWSYACKEEGDLVSKKKDTVQNCKWEESSGEYLLKIFQSLDEKGKVRKYVSKYTLKDTLILETATYNGENQLVAKTTYDKSYKKPTHFVSFHKGEKRSETNYTYKGDLLAEYEFTYKDRLRSKSIYEYQDSLLVSFKNVSSNGKEILTKLEYPNR